MNPAMIVTYSYAVWPPDEKDVACRKSEMVHFCLSIEVANKENSPKRILLTRNHRGELWTS